MRSWDVQHVEGRPGSPTTPTPLPTPAKAGAQLERWS